MDCQSRRNPIDLFQAFQSAYHRFPLATEWQHTYTLGVPPFLSGVREYKTRKGNKRTRVIACFETPDTKEEGVIMQYTTHLLRHVRATIGHAIHDARRRQKMPLPKLARLTGISVERLDQLELGKNEIQLDEVLKIRCALGPSSLTNIWG